MGVITELLDEISQIDRPWGPRLRFNPPPTKAEWDRAKLVYAGADIPDDVIEFYQYGNGTTGKEENGKRSFLIGSFHIPALPTEPIEPILEAPRVR